MVYEGRLLTAMGHTTQLGLVCEVCVQGVFHGEWIDIKQLVICTKTLL